MWHILEDKLLFANHLKPENGQIGVTDPLNVFICIFLDFIEDRHVHSEDYKSYILQFDGKVIRSQLTATVGDADYAGLEVLICIHSNIF